MMDDRLLPVWDIADPYIDEILVGTGVGPDRDVLKAHDGICVGCLSTSKIEVMVAHVQQVKRLIPEVTFCGRIWVEEWETCPWQVEGH